jgi:hypothetical protein
MGIRASKKKDGLLFENLYYRLDGFYGTKLIKEDKSIEYLIRFNFSCYTPNRFEKIRDWSESFCVAYNPDTLINPWQLGYDSLKKIDGLSDIKDEV